MMVIGCRGAAIDGDRQGGSFSKTHKSSGPDLGDMKGFR